MSKYKIFFSKQALKDIKRLSKKNKAKLKQMLNGVISHNPFFGEKLSGDYKGSYSCRINIKDGVIYGIDNEKMVVYLKRVRTHYGD